MAVCVQTGTTTDEPRTFADKMYTPYVVTTAAETNEAYLAGLCDVYTTDASGLAATFCLIHLRMILPEIVPMSHCPVTAGRRSMGRHRSLDPERYDFEELHLRQALLWLLTLMHCWRERLLGVEGGYGADDAFLNAISQVGNTLSPSRRRPRHRSWSGPGQRSVDRWQHPAHRSAKNVAVDLQAQTGPG